jgi:chaperonin GroEL
VLIERDGLSPLVTKDGVTVARSLGVDRSENNIVIEAAKEICINTAKEAGDGTTTAIVLANAIIKYGQQFISTHPKYNPQRIVFELQEVYDGIIVPYLNKYAVVTKEPEQLCSVATISANGDDKIAASVVEAVMAAGDDGQVLIEEAQGDVMRVETLDGYVVTSGLREIGQLGPSFINDKTQQQAKLDNGVVFLYDGTINDLSPLAKFQDIYENSGVMGQPILIFAHGFSDIVIDRLVKTFNGGTCIVPIKTPMSGLPNSRSMFLQDMAAYTGATVFSPININDIDETGLGSFESAKVNMYESFIISEYESEAVEARINELKSISEAALSEFDRMHLRAAISKLTGGISTIFVGGATELEVREKRYRVEDAVEAVRSAIAEGVVPGGCMVHLVLANMIEKDKKFKESWTIMTNALREPFKALITNAGEDPEEIYNFTLRESVEETKGLPTKVFDANKHQVVNPFKSGIIEPAKVVRIAIRNALSVASLLITLGGIVCVPRDSALENQLEMSKNAFKEMMSSGIQGE